ncbi:hypothetical protein INT47_000011 [Mucor saturninus]|uniref:Uncharacterized protein n=1 Tax=Mucor saturninus TaxID=64648 RepID=A0A8H7RH16_9FUNG|nr:hypothetical protein INT47_000011 [Mucor saturninus]
MGLLKLGSIYKKKNKKESSVPPVPTKQAPPAALDLNLNLNSSSSVGTSNFNNPTTTPAGSGSLFDDIFAELGTKPAAATSAASPVELTTGPKPAAKVAKEYSVLDNDFSLALALSQQLEIEQDNTKGTTGPTKQGNNNGQKKINSNVTPSYLLGGDSIYSNYLKGLSALDDNHNNNSSSLSSSMFDSILGKPTSTSTITTNTAPVAPTSTFASSNHVSQVVLDSDISDSDEDSKVSDDSEDENHKGRRHRMTKGARPIMERRTPDNPVLVQRKIDNWSNRVDSEANTVESNESMISRMKDRHRNQVKLAALRNQQQQQEEYNMMGYPQHMVPQAYGPPSMMPISPISPTGGPVLPHPGLMMDPAQMYYANPQLIPVNNNEYMETTVKTQPRSVPSAFLPNPTHVTLAIPHPPKEETETPKVVSRPPLPSPPVMTQSNNSRPNSSHARQSTAPPSSYASSKPNSSTSTLEQIEEQQSRSSESPLPMDTPSPVLVEMNAIAADEADCEISADDEATPHVALPRKKKSTKKLRQNYEESATRVIDSGYTGPTVRSSRSTPNLKKKKSSRNSSRRNSQDLTSSPPSEMTVPTPPPVPNSPYLPYHQNNSEENLYNNGVPRSSSQHQLHYQQQQQFNNQQHRQSLRHMKSEPELPRRSNSHTTQQQQQQQQQKYYHQQQQLNAEWERMQNYHQRNSVMKHPPPPPQQQQQQMPFMPMYPMYYPNNSQQMMMVDPNYQQPQQYDPYQGPAYNHNSQVTYQQQHQHKMNQHYHSRQ